MIRVIFPLVQIQGGTQIVYPDDIKYFSATDLTTSPGNIIANYSGQMALTVYVPLVVAVPSFVPQGTIVNRLLTKLNAAGLAAILNAATTDPIIQGFLFVFQAHDPVDVNYPATIQGFQYLASKGLINVADIPTYLSPGP